MVTFASKADRRGSGRSRDVLGEREASLLEEKSGDNGRLTKDEIQAIAGSLWEKKLHKFILSGEGEDVYLDAAQLAQLAAAPVSANDLAQLVSSHFKGAVRALNFIKGRMKNPQMEQAIVVAKDLLVKLLGLRWEDRLKATGISYVIKIIDDTIKVFLTILDVMRIAGVALAAQAAIESTGIDRRSPMR